MKKLFTLFVLFFSLTLMAQNKVNDSLFEPLPLNIKLDYPKDFGVDLEQLKIDGILLTRKLVSEDYLKTLPFDEQVELRTNSRYIKIFSVTDIKHKGKLYTRINFIKYDAFNGKPLPFEYKSKIIKYANNG